MKELTLHITGMSCQHCVRAVREAFAALPGVTVQEVVIGRARIAYDPQSVAPEAILDAVTAEGYGARIGQKPVH